MECGRTRVQLLLLRMDADSVATVLTPKRTAKSMRCYALLLSRA
jgi:hypothetical protein